jgi:hypothetical protein
VCENAGVGRLLHASPTSPAEIAAEHVLRQFLATQVEILPNNLRTALSDSQGLSETVVGLLSKIDKVIEPQGDSMQASLKFSDDSTAGFKILSILGFLLTVSIRFLSEYGESLENTQSCEGSLSIRTV